MSTLTWLGVPGDERAWRALGFVVDDGGFTVGRVHCTIGASGWGFDDIHSDAAALGVPTVTCPPAALRIMSPPELVSEAPFRLKAFFVGSVAVAVMLMPPADPLTTAKLASMPIALPWADVPTKVMPVPEV